MNYLELIKELRATAEELKPLAASAGSAALMWNGSAYAPPVKTSFDSGAASWQSILTVTANLLELQHSPTTPQQIEYLKQLLLGGMGSLNDLWFDSRTHGDVASVVNRNLDKRRESLYRLFAE